MNDYDQIIFMLGIIKNEENAIKHIKSFLDGFIKRYFPITHWIFIKKREGEPPSDIPKEILQMEDSLE